jgi:hypothetical protein
MHNAPKVAAYVRVSGRSSYERPWGMYFSNHARGLAAARFVIRCLPATICHDVGGE